MILARIRGDAETGFPTISAEGRLRGKLNWIEINKRGISFEQLNRKLNLFNKFTQQ